jgi:hypothetical protein
VPRHRDPRRRRRPTAPATRGPLTTRRRSA